MALLKCWTTTRRRSTREFSITDQLDFAKLGRTFLFGAFPCTGSSSFLLLLIQRQKTLEGVLNGPVGSFYRFFGYEFIIFAFFGLTRRFAAVIVGGACGGRRPINKQRGFRKCFTTVFVLDTTSTIGFLLDPYGKVLQFCNRTVGVYLNCLPAIVW